VPPAETNNRQLARLTTELNKLGFNPKAKGRAYLMKGIPLLIEDQTRNVISMMAREFRITENSVDRAIYNAINSAWNHGDIEEIQQRYIASTRSKEGVPSPSEFMHYYADKLRIEYD
jgi:hypothetical protein